MKHRTLWLATAVVAVSACTDQDTTPPSEIVASPEIRWPTLVCDPLVPEQCAFPFPSNVYTTADESTPTGLRVALDPASLTAPTNGGVLDTAPWRLSDGFSANGALLAVLPGATDEGFPTPLTIEDSLLPTSPTVLIDAETGERVPHFTELDHSSFVGDTPTLMIRPVVRLLDGARYIVAIRDVVGDGGPLPASVAFAALRDRSVLGSDSGLDAEEIASVDTRRGLYEDIFARLEDAGVVRGSLQLAWDFTTASTESNTAWMVHMRDEALAAAGEDGPAFTITDVDEDFDPRIAFRIEGTMTVPQYVTEVDAPGLLVFGDDGMPEPYAAHPTYEMPFVVLIPNAAKERPGALLQYGHGLLGSFSQVDSIATSLAEESNYVMFAATLEGMGDGDGTFIADVLASGEFQDIQSMYDRLHQGMLNYLLLMRMMRTGFADHPAFGQYIDASQRYYHGISQGGIFGGTYMALTTDAQRGVLGVPGQPYNLLLNRSVDFSPFFVLMSFTVPEATDQQMILALAQMLWDRTEPAGYTHLRGQEGFEGGDVLMRAAVGDHQVSTLGAHIMARASGAAHLDTGVRDIYGFDAVAEVESGSSYVEYEFGLPDEPICNVPMTACSDPHGEIRKLPAAIEQLDVFLRTGVTINACPDGVCRFADLSGCSAQDATPRCD